MSSYPSIVSQIQEAPVAIMGVMTAIAAQMTAPSDEIRPNIPIGARSRIVEVLNAIGITAILRAGASIVSPFPKSVLGDILSFHLWCENQVLEAIPQRRWRSLPLALQLKNTFQEFVIGALSDRLAATHKKVGDLLQ